MIARFIRGFPFTVEKWMYKLELWLDWIGRKGTKR
jgi:hypothetical protein